MPSPDPTSLLSLPSLDPTPIFEAFRGAHATELLTVAVAHLELFDRLGPGQLSRADLRALLELEERPLVVLTTALRAMGLLEARGRDPGESFALTPLAREHLVHGAELDVSDYVRLAKDSPGVLAMLERLRTNRPAGAALESEGAAYIFREGIESKMEKEADARFLTLALAGRARNCAPALAAACDLSRTERLVDVGGGSGLYALACLARHPQLRAVVWDRPKVLKVAEEMARRHGLESRLELEAGDMFVDAVPAGDAILFSNILHDWDVPECRQLVGRAAAALPAGGQLLVHDVYLDDDHAGPLPIALYSAALFSLTEGRAYSAREYRDWLVEAGLTPSDTIAPTLVHCGVLAARKG